MVRKLESLWKAGCLFYYNSISWASSSEKSDMELSDELSPVPSSCSFSASSVAYFWMYSVCDRKEKTYKQHIFNSQRMSELRLTAGWVTSCSLSHIGYDISQAKGSIVQQRVKTAAGDLRDVQDPWKQVRSQDSHVSVTHTLVAGNNLSPPRYGVSRLIGHDLIYCQNRSYRGDLENKPKSHQDVTIQPDFKKWRSESLNWQGRTTITEAKLRARLNFQTKLSISRV